MKKLKDYTEGIKFITSMKGHKYLKGWLSPSRLLSSLYNFIYPPFDKNIEIIRQGGRIADAIDLYVKTAEIVEMNSADNLIFTAFINWIKTKKISPLASEYWVLDHKNKWYSKVDIIAEFENKIIGVEVKVVDLKGDHKATQFLGEIQSLIPHWETGYPFYALLLDRKGRGWKFEKMELGEKHKEIFQDCVQVYKHANEIKLLK